MRKLISILCLPLFLFAQSENQSQSIELPDFVITGKQKVDLPVMKKAKADPVSILSKEYFFPSFTPEQFSLATVAKPKQQLADVLLQEKAYNKQLILGAGQYTLPTGQFYLSQPFSVGKFYSKLWGTNRKDYVDYADFNISGINIGSNFYVDRHSSFLPGAIFNIDGQFVRKDYNFYSPFRTINTTPAARETQNISGALSLENYYGDIFKYHFSFSGNQLDMKEVDIKEANLKFLGDTKIQFGKFALLLSGEYDKQSISRNTNDDDYSFYNAIGGIQFQISDGLILSGGVGYYNADVKDWVPVNQTFVYDNFTNDLFAPWGEIQYTLNDYISLSATYKPQIDFRTITDNLKINPYIHLRVPSDVSDNSMDNSSTKYNHKIDINLTYGYKKYYEIVVGAEYFAADNYAFFNSSFTSNNFTTHLNSFKIDKAENVKSFSVYANALYHLGPFGWFYGDAKFQNVKSDLSSSYVPYKPKLSLQVVYGYEFEFGLSAELKLHYLKDTYADIDNNIMLDDYVNLGANFRFAFTNNFDFTLHLNNLLNRDNYFWLGYIEPPFDFTAGIDFRF